MTEYRDGEVYAPHQRDHRDQEVGELGIQFHPLRL